jgi:hypothetical protein
MFPNALGSELAAIVGVIDPDAYANAAYESGYVDMSKFESLMAIVMAGDLGSSATLDFKLQSAVAASGGADITGKAITQLTQAGTDSNKQAIINLRREEMTEGHRYVKAVMTVGTAASDASAILIGINPRNAPASDNDIAAVDEIIA